MVMIKRILLAVLMIVAAMPAAAQVFTNKALFVSTRNEIENNFEFAAITPLPGFYIEDGVQYTQTSGGGLAGIPTGQFGSPSPALHSFESFNGNFTTNSMTIQYSGPVLGLMIYADNGSGQMNYSVGGSNGFS